MTKKIIALAAATTAAAGSIALTPTPAQAVTRMHTMAQFQAACGRGYHEVSMQTSGDARALLFRNGQHFCGYAINTHRHTLYTYTGGLYWANGTWNWIDGANVGNFTSGTIGPVHFTMRHGVVVYYSATCGNSRANITVRA